MTRYALYAVAAFALFIAYRAYQWKESKGSGGDWGQGLKEALAAFPSPPATKMTPVNVKGAPIVAVSMGPVTLVGDGP